MEELIKSLQILIKYGNPDYPIQCLHDEMVICGIDPKDVSESDKNDLVDLGFFVDDKQFKSFKYGSA